MSKSIKLNLNKPFLLINGEQLKYQDTGKKETIAGKLAGVLAGSVNKDEIKRMKNFNWASALMNDGKLEIDEPDLKTIRETISSSQFITDWEAGSILSEIDKQSK